MAVAWRDYSCGLFDLYRKSAHHFLTSRCGQIVVDGRMVHPQYAIRGTIVLAREFVSDDGMAGIGFALA